MEELKQEAVDSALILENKLKERVKAVVDMVVVKVVAKEVKKYFEDEKQAMMTEITLAIGKALQSIEKDGRVPLWEANPYETNIPDFLPLRADGEQIQTVEINHALQK
jgi:hypothetical protein